MRSRCIVGIVLAATVLSTASGAEASARARLEEFFQQAIAIASSATSAEKARGDLLVLAQGLFDGRGAARKALGREWNRRSDAEREQFTRMFTGSFERACLETMQALLPRTRPPVIRILGEDPAAGGVVVVRTEIRARNGDDVAFDFRMARVDERWLVHDVVIAGVSLVENYRAQFARVLRTSTYADLVARLSTVAAVPEAAIAASSRTSVPGSIAAPGGIAVPESIVTLFDTSGAEPDSSAQREIEKAAAWLAANGQASAVVEGHSDQRGDPRSNQAAVRERLVALGIDGDRVTVVTYGDQRPVCRQPVEACWPQNRRAVVRLTP